MSIIQFFTATMWTVSLAGSFVKRTLSACDQTVTKTAQIKRWWLIEKNKYDIDWGQAIQKCK